VWTTPRAVDSIRRRCRRPCRSGSAAPPALPASSASSPFATSLLALSTYSDLIAIASGPAAAPVDARQLQGAGQTATTAAIVGWSAIGVAAVLGTAAGIAVPFTNWDGAVDDGGEQP